MCIEHVQDTLYIPTQSSMPYFFWKKESYLYMTWLLLIYAYHSYLYIFFGYSSALATIWLHIRWRRTRLEIKAQYFCQVTYFLQFIWYFWPYLKFGSYWKRQIQNNQIFWKKCRESGTWSKLICYCSVGWLMIMEWTTMAVNSWINNVNVEVSNFCFFLCKESYR